MELPTSVLLLMAVFLFIAGFLVGSHFTASAWERRYVPAIMVVNAAIRFVKITNDEDRVKYGGIPRYTALDVERALEGLEESVNYYGASIRAEYP